MYKNLVKNLPFDGKMTQNGVICNTGIEMSIPMNTACIVQIFREINFAKFREIDAFSAKLH